MTSLGIILRLAPLFLLSAPLAGDDSPIVGAIRWNGWYGEGTVGYDEGGVRLWCGSKVELPGRRRLLG